MGSVECSVQMFLFFLHNHKSCLLLNVCLIGRNLGRLFQDGVCNVLSVSFVSFLERKCLTSLIDFVRCMFSGKLFHRELVDGKNHCL